MQETLKRCSRCQEEKARTEFGKSSASPDGLRFECKDCKREYDRGYSARNAEIRRERAKQWARDNRERFRELMRAAGRKRRREHPDEERRKKRVYYAANRELMRAAIRAYDKRNPELRKRLHIEYRARKRAAGGPGVTEQEWALYLAYFGDKCLACGAESDLARDHVRSFLHGGTDDILNVQRLCRPCNARKRERFQDYRDPETLARFLAALEQMRGT